jgi:ribosomal protein S18 acetylase RimI-like enzyme
MQLSDFISFHAPAFEADEIRHNLILGIMTRFQSLTDRSGLATWSLGAPGECAVKTPGHPIIFGNLSAEQCRDFAQVTRALDYPGVVGGESALRFVEFARELGVEFSQTIAQDLKVLTTDPVAPDILGFARKATPGDFDVFRDWTLAFIREAVPSDPLPEDAALKETLNRGRHWFWIVDNEPVSMAAIARRTKKAASINSVFTPPDRRGNGFAGAITATVARAIFAEGRPAACLYVDRSNPASSRCYAKLGFQPYCENWHIIRDSPASL